MDGSVTDVVVPVEPVFYEAPAAVDTEPEAIDELAPPAERTRPPWRARRWRTWQLVASSLAAVVLGLVIGRLTDSSGNSTSTRNAGTTGPESSLDTGGQPSAGAHADRTPTTATAPGATSPPTTLAGGHAVLLNIPRHTGPLITDHFTVTANRWVLGWAYDCTAQGGTGAFNITVFDGSGGPSKDGGIDQQGAKGSSVVAYSSTGERYLSVTTNCVWAVRVTT